MSLDKRKELNEIAKNVCGELRKNSTEAEKIFWEAIRNKKFYGKKFYRQYPLFHDLNGREPFLLQIFTHMNAELL